MKTKMRILDGLERACPDVFQSARCENVVETTSRQLNPRFRNFLESSPAPKVATFVEIMGESAITQKSH
jgi:hypothetical protein